MRKQFILASAVILGVTVGLLAPRASYAGGGGHGERYPPQHVLGVLVGSLAYVAHDGHRNIPVHYRQHWRGRHFGHRAHRHHWQHHGRHVHRGHFKGHGRHVQRGHERGDGRQTHRGHHRGDNLASRF